jgi:hypothetical protein
MKIDKSKLWIIMSLLGVLTVTVWSAASTSASSSTPVMNRPVMNPPVADSGFAARTNPAQPPIQPDVVMPAGTPMRIRLDSSISTRAARPGDHFSGTLASAVSVDGATVLPAGTAVGGAIVDSAPSGRLKGRAVLSLRLNTVSLNGRTLQLATASDTRVSRGHKKHNWAWIGGGGGGGILIGALAGGPVGAAIGAGSGVAAGMAGAAITGKRQVSLPAETVLTFHLSRPLTVPEHPIMS